MPKTTTNHRDGGAESRVQGVTPTGYPYPPEELWRRVIQVIKTPPDELTYRRFGEILGLEFDENRILWYGDKESRKYFFVSTNDIRNVETFPFKSIGLSQGDPDPANKMRTRRMVFDLDLFEIPPYVPLLIEQSERFCVRPKHSELEALGYHYDEIASSMPPPTDRYGVEIYRPYFEKIFVDDLSKRHRAEKKVILNVLSNGCLVGVRYFNRPKF